MKRSKQCEGNFLVQVHWQNPSLPGRTIMIAQGEFDDFNEMIDWVNAMFARDIANCPTGWLPMVCNFQSEYFVKQAAVGCDPMGDV